MQTNSLQKYIKQQFKIIKIFKISNKNIQFFKECTIFKYFNFIVLWFFIHKIIKKIPLNGLVNIYDDFIECHYYYPWNFVFVENLHKKINPFSYMSLICFTWFKKWLPYKACKAIEGWRFCVYPSLVTDHPSPNLS